MREEAGEGAIDTTGVEGVKWVASFAPRSQVRRGDTIQILADISRAHWFDPETGGAIRN